VTSGSEVWWNHSPQSELYQGDVIAALPFWTLAAKIAYLEKRTVSDKVATLEGFKEFLVESDAPALDSQGFFRFSGRGRFSPAIILTHDCEFDKRRKNTRAQVARLGDVEELSEEERFKVINQGSYSKLVPPNVPNLDRTLFVDFRIQITLDTRLLESKMKYASLSEFGRERLRAGLVYYYLRKDPPADFLKTRVEDL
jgi:hypothetical protein